MPRDAGPDETQSGREALLLIAADAIADTGTTEEAAAELLRRVGTRGATYQALIGPYVKVAARELVEAMTRQRRAAIWRPEPAAAAQARTAAVARAVTAALLDFPLPGGRLLRSANREEVEAAAERYRAQASDMAWKARWLDAIAAHLPDAGTVADHFDDAALAKLRQETNT